MDELGAAHEGREVAQLLGQRQEHLVLVVDGVCARGRGPPSLGALARAGGALPLSVPSRVHASPAQKEERHHAGEGDMQANERSRGKPPDASALRHLWACTSTILPLTVPRKNRTSFLGAASAHTFLN